MYKAQIIISEFNYFELFKDNSVEMDSIKRTLISDIMHHIEIEIIKNIQYKIEDDKLSALYKTNNTVMITASVSLDK